MGLFDDFALFDDIRAAAQEFSEVASDITTELVGAGEEAKRALGEKMDSVTTSVEDMISPSEDILP